MNAHKNARLTFARRMQLVRSILDQDLDPALFEKLLLNLRTGKPVKAGSQTGRRASCPAGGPTTLTGEGKHETEKV